MNDSKSANLFFGLFLIQSALFWIQSERLDTMKEKYDVLVEVAVAKHNGMAYTEAAMNVKSTDSMQVIGEAVAIVYTGQSKE